MSAIFERQLDQAARVKTASRARLCPPLGGGESHAPIWREIEPLDSNPLVIETVAEAPMLPAGPTNRPLFDELDIATMAARAARLGWQDGHQAATEAQDQRTQQLLGEIASQLDRFTASIELPVPAIRAQLMALLDGLLDQLEIPADEQERAQRMKAAIDECLLTLDAPGPLRLELHPGDASLINELGDGAATLGANQALELKSDPAIEPGHIRISWPGGGIEQVVAARHDALHNILESLAPQAVAADATGDQPS